ncbi:MAG: GntR family transcriptional regulator [Candidatus Rokubacteria bacterium]|nr:GntR family transcriptional regulator [Candidatus Rokubacteria bacterium]
MQPLRTRKSAVGPLKRIRLVDEAARALREAILRGELPPGTRLRQLQLAARLGISRTPLREALMKLEQEGLIELLPSLGLRVAVLNLDEAVELYDLREVLDGLAARLAAQRIAERGLRDLERHLTKMKDSLTRQEPHIWFSAHVAFHDEIFRASGNGRLQAFSSVVRLSIQRFHPILLATPNRLVDAYREHHEILEAIRARAAEAAERLARAHIANAKEIVLKVISGAPPVGAVP